MFTLPRSFMYVPGDRERLFPKAYSSGADALVLDLEDSVAPARKSLARSAVRDWLVQLDGTASEQQGAAAGGSRHLGEPTKGDKPSDPQIWARIDPANAEDDLQALVLNRLVGIFLAKTTQQNLDDVSAVLGRLESERGMEPGGIGVIGLIESAEALREAQMIASHPRLITFGIGEVDLLADLRVERQPDTESAIDSIRLQIVIAAAVTGLLPPVAPTSTRFRDLSDFDVTSRHFSALGFRSRTAIHPSQIAVIHKVLTPSSEEVRSAREVVDLFEAADGGVAVDPTGRMIDLAVVRSANEIIQRSEYS
ncbi:HpcH/HpaI aldolase/citrate lyase family protein [Brevibacterium linens]|uniref:HpcH/HpaI aldolase/citrate lyase family protein n=1 Tax=Brevibacterium linens TaxID=1703 RepID=UPI003BF5E38D